LGDTQITDDGLKQLEGFKNLTDLSLYGTKITDVGVKELRGFKNLTSIDLWDTPVTDAALKELCESLPKLKNVDESTVVQEITLLGGKFGIDDWLPGKPVTHIQVGVNFSDKHCHLLKVFTHLKSLRLDHTEITDVGLKELGELKRLTHLHIVDGGVQVSAPPWAQARK